MHKVILSRKLQIVNNDLFFRLHEDAFLRSGVRPLQGDKLVTVEVLKKCLPQLRQIIMAGLPLAAHT